MKIPDETYCERYVNPFPLDKPVIAVKAECGTGKSFQLTEWLKTTAPTYVVAVTSRRSFTAQLAARLGFESYADIKGPIDLTTHPRVCCQVESLNRIALFDGNRLRTGLCVVLDEFDAIVRQLESVMSLNRSAEGYFGRLIRYADRVIALDAAFDERLINLLESFRRKSKPEQSVHLIVNTMRPFTGNTANIFRDESKVRERLHSTLTAGRRAVCVFFNLSTMKKIVSEIREKFPEKRLKAYCSESTAEDRLDFQDVNNSWSDTDVLAYTSTVEIGLDNIDPRFGELFVWAEGNTIGSRQARQMIYRCRAVNHITIWNGVIPIRRNCRLPVRYDTILADMNKNINRLLYGVPNIDVIDDDGKIRVDESSPRLAVFIANRIVQNRSNNGGAIYDLANLLQSGGWTVKFIRGKITSDLPEEKPLTEELPLSELPEIDDETATYLESYRMKTRDQQRQLHRYNIA